MNKKLNIIIVVMGIVIIVLLIAVIVVRRNHNTYESYLNNSDNSYNISADHEDVNVRTVIEMYEEEIKSYGISDNELYNDYTYNVYDGYYAIKYENLMIIFDYNIELNEISNIEFIDTTQADPPDEED